MAYTALYREFRPKTFDEMVGQEHITKTLKNQIIANRVGHAYLFNGGRGTGKTSAAKILARAINCLNPKNGEPCNECEICKGILAGSITDVVEMDAASNNSVEDIRSIREEVNFLPTIAKYRVYIIDEVHMLSTGAFNALLKTLEEPPEHVKFILATTEPQKLPATILSRCQRFDFKRISNENIIKRLKIVCAEAKINITDEALNVIAVLSEGAMRDALSILERCVQDGITNIDDNYIKELVGIPKLTYVKKILEGIINYNVEQVLETVNIVLDEGKDITNFVFELIKYARDLLIYKTTKKLDLYSEEEIKNIASISENTDKDRLLNIIYNLSELSNNIKTSSQKTIIFQAGLISLCNIKQGNTNLDLEKRISILEEKIKNGIQIQNISYSNKTKSEDTKGKDIRTKKIDTALKTTEDFKKEDQTAVDEKPISQKWNDVLTNLKNNGKIILYTALMNTTAKEINDLTVGIEFKNGMTAFGKTILENVDNKNDLERQISIIYGKEMNVKYINTTSQNTTNETKNTTEKMISELDIPINVVD